MPTTIPSGRPGRAWLFFRARRRWTILAAVGALLVVQISTRLVKRSALVDSISTLTWSLDRAVRLRLLGPTILARRSGARAGQRVLLLGVLEEGLIEAFSETVGRSGKIEALAIDWATDKESSRSTSLPIESQRLDWDGCKEPRAPTAGGDSPDLTAAARDGDGLPFADAEFDIVCLVSVSGWRVDRDALFAETWRVLKPAGRVSISAAATNHAYQARTTLRARCRAAGFEPIEEFGNTLAYTVNFRKPIRRMGF